jgi:glycosyltransferase involved in cell wall biosynthesis
MNGIKRKTRVLVTVISDLVTDQRVHKVCTTLSGNGYEVVLIGARKRQSAELGKRVYKTSRINMYFQKKAWFYAEFNTRLFLKLLFAKGDIILGNDLDVMPASFFAARIRGLSLVYDTHEYFLGMPELDQKPRIKKTWGLIERLIFPRLGYVYTICQSFCDLYYKDYGKKISYVLNVPYLNPGKHYSTANAYAENIPVFPEGKHLLLFQGAGINVERGVEELVLAMEYLDPEKFHLLIVGGGDIFEKIKGLVRRKAFADRITIIPKVPFEVLRSITCRAHLGLTLDKPTNINHIYGLPNKIFDYLHAGVPVLSSRLVELERIITNYDVGAFIDNHNPQHIAACIENIFARPGVVYRWKLNCSKVKADFNWEKEEKKILAIFESVKKARLKS